MTSNSIKPISQRIHEIHDQIVELSVALDGASNQDVQRLQGELQQARQELDYLLQIVKTCLS